MLKTNIYAQHAADYAMHCKIIHIESGDIRISKKAPFNFKIKKILMSAYCKSIKK